MNFRILLEEIFIKIKKINKKLCELENNIILVMNNNMTTTMFSMVEASGTGIDNIILIPHNLNKSLTYFNAIPTTMDAGNISSFSSDNTYIYIHYNIAPPEGIKNLKYNIVVR